MTAPHNRLTDLLTNRVALVPRGANQKAHVLVVKSADDLSKLADDLGGPLGVRLKRSLERTNAVGKAQPDGADMTPAAIVEHLAAGHGLDFTGANPKAAYPMHDAAHANKKFAAGKDHTHTAKADPKKPTPEELAALFAEIGKADDEVWKAGRKISASRLKRLRDAHGALARVIEEAEVAEPVTDPLGKADPSPSADDTMTCPACGAGNESDAKFCDQCGAKMTAPPITKGGTVEKLKEDELAKLDPEVRKHIEGLYADVEKGAKPDPDPADPIEKALKGDDPIAKALAERLTKAEAAGKAAEAKADAEIAKREVAEETAFLTGLSHIGLDVAKLAPEMRVLKTAAPTTYAETATALKAANEQARVSSLFSKFGSDAIFGKDTAYGKLEAVAAEIKKADPKLTSEQAFAKAVETNPELAEQFEDERKEANR